MKHLVTMAEQNGCHGYESKNDAMTTYWFRQLVEISVQKKQVSGCAEHARDGGVIQVTAFPT